MCVVSPFCSKVELIPVVLVLTQQEQMQRYYRLRLRFLATRPANQSRLSYPTKIEFQVTPNIDTLKTPCITSVHYPLRVSLTVGIEPTKCVYGGGAGNRTPVFPPFSLRHQLISYLYSELSYQKSNYGSSSQHLQMLGQDNHR